MSTLHALCTWRLHTACTMRTPRSRSRGAAARLFPKAVGGWRPERRSGLGTAFCGRTAGADRRKRAGSAGEDSDYAKSKERGYTPEVLVRRSVQEITDV